MPYGYYQFLRIIGCIGFLYLAYDAYQNKLNVVPMVFGIFGILLNPVFKISFEREIWQILDFIMALVTLFQLLFDKKINRFLKNG